MKLNERHLIVAYVDDMNLLGDNIDTICHNIVLWHPVTRYTIIHFKIQSFV
jgi:hypothetical protein